MTATVRHLTHPTVAPTARAEALAWIARQRAWELRLQELEAVERPTPHGRTLARLARTA